MPLPIRLVAMDMDDTLLQDDWTISERTIDAIRQAQKQGVYVTFATGRATSSVLPYARQLGLNVPVITYNGAKIQEILSGEILYRRVIPIETAKDISEWLLAQHIHFHVYLKDHIFVEKMNDLSRQYARATRVPVEEIDIMDRLSAEQEGVEKILLMGEPEMTILWNEKIHQRYEGKVRSTKSKPRFLELIHPMVSKGTALASLAERLGVKREEVMAVGDSLNDIEMIRYAGLGIAMGNARAEVKEIADKITATNQEDGVAQAIEEYVLR